MATKVMSHTQPNGLTSRSRHLVLKCRSWSIGVPKAVIKPFHSKLGTAVGSVNSPSVNYMDDYSNLHQPHLESRCRTHHSSQEEALHESSKQISEYCKTWLEDVSVNPGKLAGWPEQACDMGSTAK